VIATTAQLWLQRRVLGGPETPAGRRRRSRRRAGAFGLAIVVFAAGALTIALAQGRDTSAGKADARPIRTVKLSTGSLRAAEQNRQQAAAWVATQVSRAAIVSCDPVMCSALQRRGVPAGDLLPLGSSATDPMGSQIVVATTVLRSQLGSRLADVYAPAVIASFGTGASRVDVRVEAADGGRAYLLDERADLLARRTAGQQLLRNKDVHVTPAARQELAAGRIDSRLLATLAALTAQRHIQKVLVYSFGDAGPGAPGAPLRMMRIAALIPRRHHARDTYLTAVLRFLRAQQPPYLASGAVLHLPGRKTAVQIQFTAPSPLGLLGAAPSR
jgi:hypothetical protein